MAPQAPLGVDTKLTGLIQKKFFLNNNKRVNKSWVIKEVGFLFRLPTVIVNHVFRENLEW